MKNYMMVISYDGSEYSGWQRQNHHRSIQGTIEQRLSRLIKEDIKINGAGRTDAGVHSVKGQTATFCLETNISPSQLKFALNRALPQSIHIDEVAEVPMEFHARYHAIGKTYEYRLNLLSESNPLRVKYTYFLGQKLDLEKIDLAMNFFLGTHDFSAFMASGSKIEDTVRTIYNFERKAEADEQVFKIEGDGFLYNMIRIIMGVLIRVGQDKLEVEDIPMIIKSGDRALARWTAPACGLYLKSVHYPERFSDLLNF